jgi:glycosyltransferase involved in cell wall biosynthesis
MKVSIVICTRNRSEDLRLTLEAIGRLAIRKDLSCELLVIDNASEDNTAAVVRSIRTPSLPVRYVYEPRPGQSNARNRGLAASEGEVLLFTDDDVRPPQNWVERMCGPIVEGKAHGVAGGVVLAPELQRAWMTPMHCAWLAASVRLDPRNPQQMIGANMAFARSVLAKVPAFDPELGPGATGAGDDVLFSFQLKEAGFRLISAFDVAVVHHFQSIRLRREQWLAAARCHADTQAYLRHHWYHEQMGLIRFRYWKALVLLMACRLRPSKIPAEGCSRTELRLRVAAMTHRKFLVERKRSRNYEKRGLCRLTGDDVLDPPDRAMAVRQVKQLSSPHSSPS